MAVSKRRGKWVADFRDAFNIRRVPSFDTKAEAETAEAKGKLEKNGQTTKPVIDPDITLTDYAARFLSECGARLVKDQTRERYERALRVHVIPRLGRLKVRDVSRPLVKGLLVGKLEDVTASIQGQKGEGRTGRRKLARGTVRHLLATLNAIMGSAVEDGVIAANPLQKLRKKLNLGTRRDHSKPKAFDSEQLFVFMDAARKETPDLYPAFMLLGLAGLRIGEAVGLTWDRVDLTSQKIRVDRQLGGTTKTEASERTVDVADPLRDVLADLLARRRQKAFRRGEPVSQWVLFPDLGEAPDRNAEQRVVKLIRRGMARVLKTAGLAPWHTPHSLRHTFGSLLVAAGTSLAYVKEQMGHASIQMTVDVYGSWLPKSDVAAVNKVFGKTAPGSKVVASAVPDAAGRL